MKIGVRELEGRKVGGGRRDRRYEGGRREGRGENGSFYIAQYPVRWTAQSASHSGKPSSSLALVANEQMY